MSNAAIMSLKSHLSSLQAELKRVQQIVLGLETDRDQLILDGKQDIAERRKPQLDAYKARVDSLVQQCEGQQRQIATLQAAEDAKREKPNV